MKKKNSSEFYFFQKNLKKEFFFEDVFNDMIMSTTMDYDDKQG
jgi:hypothetical protein